MVPLQSVVLLGSFPFFEGPFFDFLFADVADLFLLPVPAPPEVVKLVIMMRESGSIPRNVSTGRDGLNDAEDAKDFEENPNGGGGGGGGGGAD